MFPNLKFHVLKNQIDILKSLIDPQSFATMTQPYTWDTIGGKYERVEAMTLALSGWWKTK